MSETRCTESGKEVKSSKVWNFVLSFVLTLNIMGKMQKQISFDL